MKQLIFITLLILLSISCGKKVTVKGRAYNALTNEGISDVSVNISREKANLTFSYDGAGSKSIDSDITDSDGKYSIDYRHKSRSYQMFFSYDEDRYIALNSQQYNLSQENKTIDFPLVPIGYLKQKVENVSCFDENDLLSIVKSHEIHKNDYGNEIIWEGCVDWEYSGSLDGSPQGYVFVMMGWHYAKGFVIKNGVQTEIKDSIYVGEQEFVTWHIKY